MNKTDLIGNITTLIKLVSMILAGYVIGITASHGLQLPVTESQIAEAISTILFIILAYFDARYPNTIIDKQGSAKEPTVMINVPVEQLEDAIKQASDEDNVDEIVVEHDDEETSDVIGDDQQ